MKRLLPQGSALAACLSCLLPLQVWSASLITQVVQTGGDGDRPPAAFTGQTLNILGGAQGHTVPPYGDGVFAMTDRVHVHKGAGPDLPIPDYLVGREYIMIANNNRDNPNLRLDVGLSQRCFVYLLVDNRIGDNSNANPPTFGALMQWVLDEGWQPVLNGLNRAGNPETPDETAWDESNDGTLNQYASVYVKVVEPGEIAFSTFAGGAGLNVYSIVVDSAVAPAAPSDLTVVVSGDSFVRLSWQRAAGAVRHHLYRSTTPGGPYDLIASDLIANTFDDTTVVNGTPYHYVVNGSNVAGIGANSAEVTARPDNSPQGVAAQGGEGKVTLIWNPFAGASSYAVKRSDQPGGPYSDVLSGVSGTTAEDTTVRPGRTYYYVVLAQTPTGPSGASPEVSASTAPSIPTIRVEGFSTVALKVICSTTDTVPATYTIEQAGADGNDWVELPTLAEGRSYYIAADLAPGSTHQFRARASNASGTSETSAAAIGSTPESGIYINFANPAFAAGVEGYPLPGFLDDYGDAFDDRGNGFIYGWDVSNTAHARLRNSANSPDRRYDTFNHLQKPQPAGQIWEMEIAEGSYQIRIVGGDADNLDSVFQFLVEGVLTDTLTPSANNRFIDTTVVVSVSDGRLTIENAPGAANNKIAFIEISTPSVVQFTSTQLVDGQLRLEWSGGGTLQWTDSLNEPIQWRDAGTGGTFAEPATGPRKLYRVVKP